MLSCVPGRLWWTSAGEGQGRSLLPGGHHQLGHRVCRGQSARGLHKDIQVCPLDPADGHVAEGTTPTTTRTLCLVKMTLYPLKRH